MFRYILSEYKIKFYIFTNLLISVGYEIVAVDTYIDKTIPKWKKTKNPQVSS